MAAFSFFVVLVIPTGAKRQRAQWRDLALTFPANAYFL